MKRLATIFFAAALLSTTGCGSSRPQAHHYSFEFVYGGDDYQIISVVVPGDRGHNFLTRRDNGRVVFSAKDEDQNGTIDIILVGDLGLTDADLIYQSGIDIARAGDRYREFSDERTYQYFIAGDPYRVNSLADGGEAGFYNTFVFINADGQEVIAIDENADGELDGIRKGNADLSASDELYSMVLREGVRDGKIVSESGRYRVSVK